MKRHFIALILAFAGFISLHAATVSVLVVEAGFLSGTGRTQSAAVWESGIMDVLFDAGHIVFNAPILRIPAAPGNPAAPDSQIPLQARRDFDEARLGGAEFFVMVLLLFPEGGPEHPREIRMKIFSVSTGKLLYESSVIAKPWEDSGEELADAKKSAERLIPQLVHRGS
ncbi:MAG: hypothetical protein LBE02_03105 [Spirochaetaceae bacterium]|jgi:hypothetical protein|nr:hypothetical protein [Spirochaetaceae bacterium]